MTVFSVCSERSSRTLRVQEGFTLLETALVLVVIGLLFTGAAAFTGDILSQDVDKETARKFDRIERALTEYATVHRRLPCPTQVPDIGGAPDGTAMTRRVTACPGDQRRGVVPWATLGLDRDEALDGHGHYITYRVDDESDGVVRENGLYMVHCYGAAEVKPDTAAPQKTRNCATRQSVNKSANPEPGEGSPTATVPDDYTATANFLKGKGIAVRRSATELLADPDAGTGAAYVLVSHGRDGALAYGVYGNQRSGDKADADETVNNPKDEWSRAIALRAAEPGAFDDLVRWKGLLQLAEAAGIGPALYTEGALPPPPPPEEEKPMAGGPVIVPTLPADLQKYIPSLADDPNNVDTGLNTLEFEGGNFDSGGGNVGADDDGMGVAETDHFGDNPSELGRDETLGVNFTERHAYLRLVMSLFNKKDDFYLSFYDGETPIGRLLLSPRENSKFGEGAWWTELSIKDEDGEGIAFDRIEFLAANNETSSFIHRLEACPAKGNICSKTPSGLSSKNNYRGQVFIVHNWPPTP